VSGLNSRRRRRAKGAGGVVSGSRRRVELSRPRRAGDQRARGTPRSADACRGERAWSCQGISRSAHPNRSPGPSVSTAARALGRAGVRERSSNRDRCRAWPRCRQLRRGVARASCRAWAVGGRDGRPLPSFGPERTVRDAQVDEFRLAPIGFEAWSSRNAASGPGCGACCIPGARSMPLASGLECGHTKSHSFERCENPPLHLGARRTRHAHR
jgi:hypothetical protein